MQQHLCAPRERGWCGEISSVHVEGGSERRGGEWAWREGWGVVAEERGGEGGEQRLQKKKKTE